MDLSSLNNKQKEAVTAPLGPILILAGAGSGKTRALAYRIAYLAQERLINPENILALTFTNKAAKEMGERVRKILAIDGAPSSYSLPTAHYSLPHMGTFHSVCARVLRQEIHNLGYSRGFTIYDTEDQFKIIREIIAELQIDKRWSPSFFRAMISSAKNILQTPLELNIGLDPDRQNLVREVYARYQDFLFKQNGTDFDDLLMLTVKIFQNFPPILKKYRDVFKYILVDEYQDTNHAQYVLLRLLAGGHKNLFVVGDDAQSIYGFRGSSIRNILNFEEDFADCKVVKLEQNYRSTRNILAVAQKVIEMNAEQKPKTLWTENDHGQKVEVRETEDESEEAEFVAKKIIAMSTGAADQPRYAAEAQSEPAGFSILDHFLRKAKHKNQRADFGHGLRPQLPKDHSPLSHFAVLFRTHSQSRALEEVFMESAIPYQIVGGVKFYERREIKDLIAYLRLTVNYRDLVSLRRVINEPARGIGEKTYSIIRDLIMKESVSVKANSPSFAKASNFAEASSDKSEGKQFPITNEGEQLARFRNQLREVKFGPKIGKTIDSFFDLLDSFSSLEPGADFSSLLRLIVKRINFEDSLRDGTEQGEDRWENVRELFNVAKKFSGRPWREGLEEFLEEVSLITEIDELEGQKDSVTMMTLHSAKGLEYDTVFLVGLEEGLLPHSRSLLEPSELSEEIRLAYVGLTRARKNLFLTYAKRRLSFGNFNHNQPSRILRVLPPDKIIHKGRRLDAVYSYEEGVDGESGEETY